MVKQNSKSISKIIEDRINNLQPGKIITYDDFDLPKDAAIALAKSLSRLVKCGELVRLSKGKFYKPKESVFGSLKPAEKELVKDLIMDNNTVIGYVTGTALFNRMGLTTQIPNEYTIATNKEKKAIQREGIKIRFIKQENRIYRKNIKYLQLLDAIRDLKNIPGGNIDEICRLIRNMINDLSDDEKQRLVKLALKYNPSTRALTGAFLDSVNSGDITNNLKKSLNPLTMFELGIDESILPTKSYWLIK